MRSSSLALLGTLVLASPSGAQQYDHTAALAPLPVTDVTCRVTLSMTQKAREATGAVRTVMLTGKYPARMVTVGLDAADNVVNFHSLVYWFYPAMGDESVDVWYERNAAVAKRSARSVSSGFKAARRTAKTALMPEDFEAVGHLTADVLKRCGKSGGN